MSDIRIEDFTMPAASVGPRNPLPDLKTVQYVHSGVTVGPHVTAAEKSRIGYGMVQSILPYQLQDGYDRRQIPRSFRAVTLENETLRATFLPEVGGRLWSLYHKGEGRELLHVNPVFQPCHLALRNAWFSGGVEWNVGIKGHNPYTCDPLHAEIVEYEGLKALRMYEYERIRRCVYCIEACLPDGAPALYVKVRIENAAGEETPMYWWSNIAVDETANTRVIAPADEALECFYSGSSYYLDKVSMPLREGVDRSYPARLNISTDFFYCVPEENKKWICAVEQDGKGLFEASTDNLWGKKVFQWGMTAGGRHWQEFLSRPGSAYLEIQAGLARTQLEHIPMQAGEAWEFMEAYGMVSAGEGGRSPDWHAAQAAAEKGIFAILGQATPDKMLRDPRWQALSRTQGTPVTLGSGWGALENRRRRANGQPPLSPVYAFSEASLGEEQADWLRLLESGAFPQRPVQDAPRSFMADKAWLPLLEKAQDWFGALQYGVALYAQGDAEGAERAFRRSFQLRENGWACRNIAQLEKLKRRYDEAEGWLQKAAALLPGERHIAGEYAALLNDCGRSQQFLSLYDALPQAVRKHPRLVLQKIIALCRTGCCQEARRMLEAGLTLPDIREGEASLAAVWEEIQAACEKQGAGRKPLPYALDFRMH